MVWLNEECNMARFYTINAIFLPLGVQIALTLHSSLLFFSLCNL